MPKKDEQSTEVVKWEDMMAAEAKDVAKTERPSVARISLQSGVMSYEGTAVPDNTLECIVAAAIQENVYYDKAFQPGVVNPPRCFAFGNPGEPMRAHESVPEGDWDNWPDCATCAFMQWGSGLRDGQPTKGKRCGERRKLAILPRLDSPEDYKTAEIAVLSLPVMSVRNWSNYVNQIAAQLNRPSWGMITRIKVVPDARAQFVVGFEAVCPLAEDFMAPVHGSLEQCLNVLNVPYDMTPPAPKEPEGDKKY